MNISQAELMAHPLMRTVTADIAETRAKQDAERVSAEIEARRLRQEHAKYLAAQYEAAVQEYERLRAETHAAVGRIWFAVQAYSELTGGKPQGFAEPTFNEINLPTLIPNPSPWAQPSGGFTTTQAAVMGYFNTTTHRKTWV